MSPAAEYAEEAAFYRTTLRDAARHPIETILELGSGGGNNASHMKRHFKEMVLVDISPGMLAMSRALNPELDALRGRYADGAARPAIRCGLRARRRLLHDDRNGSETSHRDGFRPLQARRCGIVLPRLHPREFRGCGGPRRRGRGRTRNEMAIVAVASRSRRDRRTSWTTPISFARATVRCALSTTATLKDSFRATRGCSCSRTSDSHIRPCRSSTPIWSPESTKCLSASGRRRPASPL